MPAFSKPQKDISLTPLNPMVFNARFSHITEKILKKMNMKTLKNCRQVSTLWQEFIDDQGVLWKNEAGTKAFQKACNNGQSKLAVILIKNSKRFNIDISSTPLNPMVFSGRYLHITEKNL